MSILPQVFRIAFNRFQDIHREECGFPLDSFRNPESFAFKEEDYKEDVAREAVRVLDARHWSRAEIGTGAILDRVIRAIELRGNNLLRWPSINGPGTGVHQVLYDTKRKKNKRQKLEKLFFDLYHEKQVGQTQFDGITDICKNCYGLLAYLFFIADRHRFLPISTTWFDKALAELGFNFKTARQCGWENYQLFLAAMNEVQARLQAEGIADATLLDAHSFCWILARFPRDGTSEPQQTARIRHRIFAGRLHDVSQPDAFTPNDDAPAVDMQAASLSRVASGQIAEDIAFQAEKERLQQEGREDLAERVEMVADRPGLGFDIKSFDADETPRCIEVKNVSGGNRFFLTHGEWQNSRARPNYWFYLVSGVDENRPLVTFLPAAQIQQHHLQATQYLITFTP